MSKIESSSEDRLCRNCGSPHEFKSNYCGECGPDNGAYKQSHTCCQEEFLELIAMADDISEAFKRMSDRYKQALDTMRARRSRNK